MTAIAPLHEISGLESTPVQNSTQEESHNEQLKDSSEEKKHNEQHEDSLEEKKRSEERAYRTAQIMVDALNRAREKGEFPDVN